MTTGASLNDVKNLLGQIKNYGFDSGSWGLDEKEKEYVNSVWTAGEGVEEIANGNNEEKAQGFQKLLKQLLSMAGHLSEASDARKEVSEQEKTSQELTSATEETNKKISTAISEIANGITEEAEVITAAQGEIDKAQQVLEEKQKELQETLEKIDELQKELSQSTDPSEQNGLLGQISTLSSSIPNIVAEISNIQQILVDNISEVASSVQVMQKLEGTAETTAETGAKEIQAEKNEAKKLASDGTSTTVTGGINEGVAGAAEAAQTATTVASAIPGVGAAAQAEQQKLGEIAREEHQAGRDTRIPGGTETLRSVSQALGTVNSSLNYLAEFKNAIGSGLQNYANVVGTFGETVEPMITSLGSFNDGKDIIKTQEELSEAIESDYETISTSQSSTTTTNSEKNSPFSFLKNSNTSQESQNSWFTTQPASFFESGENKEQKNNLKTPTIKFGI